MVVAYGTVLTIPFGLLGTVGNGFWDGLQSAFDACPGHSSFVVTPDKMYSVTFSALNAIVYAAVSSICCTVSVPFLRIAELLTVRAAMPP